MGRAPFSSMLLDKSPQSSPQLDVQTLSLRIGHILPLLDAQTLSLRIGHTLPLLDAQTLSLRIGHTGSPKSLLSDPR